MRTVLAALMLLWLALPAFAVNPDEMLKDAALEARARTISEGLRCLVCQNESIDDSDADLAHEIRVLVRQRLVAGDTDDQARQFLVDRYGEYVLLKPVVAPHTLVLWLAAPTLLIVGAIVIFVAIRRRNPASQAALTPEEQAALVALGERDAAADSPRKSTGP
jgi:cytochrome c-type biogenesis protein CcmH